MGKELLGRRRWPSEVGRTTGEEADAPRVHAQAPQVGDFQQRRKGAGLHSRQRSGETLVETEELGDPFYPTRPTPRTAPCGTRAHMPLDTQMSPPLHLDKHTLPLVSRGGSGLGRLLRPSLVCPEAHTEGRVGLPHNHLGALEPGDGAAGAEAGPRGPLLL